MTHQTFPKPTSRLKAKNRTVTKLRKAKRRKAEKVKRSVYELVDERDEKRCVPCRHYGRYTSHSLQHHHIIPRSLGGQHTTGNVICICAECHDAIKKNLTITGNADKFMVISWR